MRYCDCDGKLYFGSKIGEIFHLDCKFSKIGFVKLEET